MTTLKFGLGTISPPVSPPASPKSSPSLVERLTNRIKELEEGLKLYQDALKNLEKENGSSDKSSTSSSKEIEEKIEGERSKTLTTDAIKAMTGVITEQTNQISTAKNQLERAIRLETLKKQKSDTNLAPVVTLVLKA